MRLPIKRTQQDPRRICASSVDPLGFEEAVSAIKIDTTWRTTKRNRQPITDGLICAAEPESVLEIGASSGTASLDLLDRLTKVSRYYLTDLFFSIPYVVHNGATYFYHPLTKRCVMRVTDLLTVYADTHDAIPLMNAIARAMLSEAPQCDGKKSASLLHPSVLATGRVIAAEYDIFQPWRLEPVEAIKVANVLNRSYFSDDQIKQAVANLTAALKPNGRLFITDNKKEEHVAVFRKSADTLVLERNIGATGAAEVISR